MDKQQPIIRTFHLYKRYGAHAALNDITLEIGRGEFVFISGPSGAGKTTLMKLFYLGESISEGQVLVDGMNLSRIHREKIPYLRRLFGIIFQDYNLIPSKTVFENISLVLEIMGYKKNIITKKVRSVLRTVGMENRLDAYPPSLSGGEQQKITVARAIVGDPKIILADEPTGSLDDESAESIMTLLREFHERGTTVVIATHDKELIQKTEAREMKLRDGRLQDISDQHLTEAQGAS